MTKTFNLNQGNTSGSIGTVLLTQCTTASNPCTGAGTGTGYVEVKITLNPGSNFVSTGSHIMLAWNLNFATPPALTISNLTSNFTFPVNGVASSESDFGAYQYGVDCIDDKNNSPPKCHGGSGPAGPIFFDLTKSGGLLISNFFPTSGGKYFGVDVFNGSTGATGLVWAAVPEPASLLIFGAGLAGAAALRRRRKPAKAV